MGRGQTTGKGQNTLRNAPGRKGKRRVLIVDDHPIVRAGLAHLLRQDPDIEICGEAGSAQEALSVLDRTQPDLILVDISLGGCNGIELTKAIRERRPEAAILVLSMHDEHLYAERALRAGAGGYVMKQEPTEVLLQAVRQVLEGKIFVSEGVSSALLSAYVEGRSPDPQKWGVERLSDRELEVFELIARGLATRKIAESLHLSVKTVEAHRTHIKHKLNLSGSAELVKHAVSWLAEGLER